MDSDSVESFCPNMELTITGRKDEVAKQMSEADAIDMDGVWDDDDEEFYTSRLDVQLNYHRMIAVWSCDKSIGATDIIPLLAKNSQISDIHDKWKKNHHEWLGLLVFYKSSYEAYRALDLITNLRINGRWPLRGVNIGKFLQFVYDTEMSLNREVREIPTAIIIENLPPGTGLVEVRNVCKEFGCVVDIRVLNNGGQNRRPRFLVSYLHSADAYAARTVLESRRVLASKVEVKMIETVKTILVNKEASRKDILLWCCP